MRESNFQKNLIKELKDLLPDSIITKTDSGYIQGIPDLLILCGKKWACLECKKDGLAHHQPNQDYYVEKLGAMGFASFIYPEIKDSVIENLLIYLLS